MATAKRRPARDRKTRPKAAARRRGHTTAAERRRPPAKRSPSLGAASRRKRSGPAARAAPRTTKPARAARGGSPAAATTGRWLVKTEPSQYAYADLARDGRTAWEGIRNPLALIHMRAMREGDPVLVYHTGNEKAVVGLARVARGPYPDPALADERWVVVDLAAVAAAPTPVPMAVVRAEPSCADIALVRIPRLSVMPVRADAFETILRRAGL